MIEKIETRGEKPEIISFKLVDLANQLELETNNQRIQTLLNRVSRRFYQKHSTSKNPLLTSLRPIIRSLGFHAKSFAEFVESLQKSGVPVGELRQLARLNSKIVVQRYFFVTTKHAEVVKKVLTEDPALKKFLECPVKQVAGPKSQPPTTTELLRRRNNGNWNVLLPLFLEFGVRIGGKSKLKPIDILAPDCPVPIFSYRRKYFYHSEHRGQLRLFLAEKIGELKNRKPNI